MKKIKPVYSSAQIALLEDRLGMRACCDTCIHFGSDGPGESPGSDWPVCDNPERAGIDNLTTFPFKKALRCWEPSFWSSCFVDEVERIEDVNKAKARFDEVIDFVEWMGGGQKTATKRPIDIIRGLSDEMLNGLLAGFEWLDDDAFAMASLEEQEAARRSLIFSLHVGGVEYEKKEFVHDEIAELTMEVALTLGVEKSVREGYISENRDDDDGFVLKKCKAKYAITQRGIAKAEGRVSDAV